jgi:hypothetical protein
MIVLQILKPETTQVDLVLYRILQSEVVHHNVVNTLVIGHCQAELLVGFHR